MKLWLAKVGKLDACIRPLFANSVTYILDCQFVVNLHHMGIGDLAELAETAEMVEMMDSSCTV